MSCLVFSILKVEKSEKISRSIAGKQFTVCYKTEVTSIVRGHHVYKEVWDATIGEMLEAASDDREEVKEYDKYAVGLYKRDLLVGHIPIEVSSLCFHFINQDPGNKTKKTRFKLPYSSSLFLELLQAYYGVFGTDAPSRSRGPLLKKIFKKGGGRLFEALRYIKGRPICKI